MDPGYNGDFTRKPSISSQKSWRRSAQCAAHVTQTRISNRKWIDGAHTKCFPLSHHFSISHARKNSLQNRISNINKLPSIAAKKVCHQTVFRKQGQIQAVALALSMQVLPNCCLLALALSYASSDMQNTGKKIQSH